MKLIKVWLQRIELIHWQIDRVDWQLMRINYESLFAAQFLKCMVGCLLQDHVNPPPRSQGFSAGEKTLLGSQIWMGCFVNLKYLN